MAMMQKAKRTLGKIKMGIAGSSGSGKTVGGLIVAYGMLKAQYPNLPDAAIWDKICIIDTENGSASLYVNQKFDRVTVGEYYTIPLTPPFEPEKYQEAIYECEKNGIEVAIIDSLTHAWAGEGGLLDIQGKAAQRGGNSYMAWRDVTPRYSRLIDKILQSDMHIIMTLRSKTEYVVETNQNGKSVPKKVGTSPIMRDGIEYEMTIFFDVDQQHTAFASKDRTNTFDKKYFTITPETGHAIHKWWVGGGAEAIGGEQEARATMVKPENTPTPDPAPVVDDLPVAADPSAPLTREAMLAKMNALIKALNPEDRNDFANKLKAATGTTSANYKTYTDAQLTLAVAAFE